MENDHKSTALQLSNKKENPNHVYLFNDRTQKYDVIDKTTGKLILAREKSEIAFLGSEFSFEVGEIVCDLVRQGKSFTEIGSMENMPSAATIGLWRRINSEFRKSSDNAIKDRAFFYHDKALELVSGEKVGKDDVPYLKTQLDTFKWAAERADPERFGQKKQELQLQMPSVIVLNTGIDNSNAPSLDELLGNDDVKPKVASDIDADFIDITKD